jgi:glutamyl-tRNA(Gln) amidotransferase subunit E
MFLDGGVPEEVRRSLPDDTTEYMRPLPGAARMYPETDVPPLRISSDVIQRIMKHLPEHPTEKQKRFIKEYQLHEEQVKQLLESGYEHDFERLVQEFPMLKNTIIRTFLNTFPELEHEGIPIDNIDERVISLVFSALSKDQFAKEAVPLVLKYLIQHQNTSLDEAVTQCGLQITGQDAIVQCIRDIVSNRKNFIKQRGKTAALGPLMGVVMKELRGKVDGKVISTILEQEIDKVI